MGWYFSQSKCTVLLFLLCVDKQQVPNKGHLFLVFQLAQSLSVSTPALFKRQTFLFLQKLQISIVYSKQCVLWTYCCIIHESLHLEITKSKLKVQRQWVFSEVSVVTKHGYGNFCLK